MKKISEDSVIKVYELNDTKEIENILRDKNWLQFKFMGYELIVEEIVEEESFNEKLNKILSRPYYILEEDVHTGFLDISAKTSNTHIISEDIEVRDETIKCLNKEIEDLKNEVERWSGKYQVKHLECADTMILLDAMTNDRNKLLYENISLEKTNKELKRLFNYEETENDKIKKMINCMSKENNSLKKENEKLRKQYPKQKMIKEVEIVDDLIRQSEYVSELKIKDINKHQTMIQIVLNK